MYKLANSILAPADDNYIYSNNITFGGVPGTVQGQSNSSSWSTESPNSSAWGNSTNNQESWNTGDKNGTWSSGSSWNNTQQSGSSWNSTWGNTGQGRLGVGFS